ncbi:bacterio-opsin activator HTH domain-containing p rotein [Mycobacterium sp. PO1]|nr:bacterio-opsin activator HTH domain-containing p rotein [Mycobacterium sp. PO1]
MLTAHQTHRFEFGVDARGGDHGDALPLGEAAVGGQLRAGSQLAGTNLGSEGVDETFVSRGGHP